MCSTGVQVQEGHFISILTPCICSHDYTEVLSELNRAQESATNLRDSIRQHHLARAKICSKILKYPNIADYIVSNPHPSCFLANRVQIALQEHDEKQFTAAIQNLHDLRHIYAVMTDIIHKNIVKVSLYSSYR